MPHYDFRCPQCGLEYEVSRPISRATDPAPCPTDATPGERVFAPVPMLVRGGSTPTAWEAYKASPNAPMNQADMGVIKGPGLPKDI